MQRKPCTIYAYIILIVTSFLYVIPFHCPLLWPLFFLLPSSFMLLRNYKLSFSSCFVWGMVFWGLHLLAVFQALFQMAEVPLIKKIAPIVAVWIYAALFPALWLWISFRFISYSLWVWTL